MSVQTIDVNPDLKQAHESSACSRFHNVLIQADADPATLTVQPMLTNTYKEDDSGVLIKPWRPNGIPLSIAVAPSLDNSDKSEYLEIKLSVPVDSSFGAPIGTLNALSDPSQPITVAKIGLTGQYEVWKITVDNSLAAQQQGTALNNYMASNLFFVPADNWAGQVKGTSGIKVELFSIEKATGDQVALKERIATEYINVDVLPVVSSPSTFQITGASQANNCFVPWGDTRRTPQSFRSKAMPLEWKIPK